MLHLHRHLIYSKSDQKTISVPLHTQVKSNSQTTFMLYIIQEQRQKKQLFNVFT